VKQMIVFLGDTRADIRECEDRTAAAAAGPQMLSEPDPDTGSFFTVRLEGLTDPRSSHTYGVGGGPGSLVPALLGRTWGALVWLGAGLAVYAIDPVGGKVVEHGFESPFREFFVPASAGVLVVAFETGLRGFAPDGTESWRADTDLVEDLRWSQDTVTVEQMGLPAARISLATGRPAG
jgi:hypothetical protein